MKNKRQYVCKLLVYSVSYVGSTYFTSVPPSFPEVPALLQTMYLERGWCRRVRWPAAFSLAVHIPVVGQTCTSKTWWLRLWEYWLQEAANGVGGPVSEQWGHQGRSEAHHSLGSDDTKGSILHISTTDTCCDKCLIVAKLKDSWRLALPEVPIP